jgi:hypothetical protein
MGPSSKANVTISFAVPLAAPLGADKVHYITATGKELVFDLEGEEFEEVTQTACTGNAGNPTAASGELCVYEAFAEEIDNEGATERVAFTASGFINDPAVTATITGVPSAGKAGARIFFQAKEGFAAPVSAWGSWAVTG